MMDGFGREEDFEQQPKLKLFLDDGREMDLKGLVGIMITDEGEYTAILYGHYTLPKLAIIQRIFNDTIEDATNELVEEIQQEIIGQGATMEDWEELNVMDLFQPPAYDEILSIGKPKAKPKSKSKAKPKMLKEPKDPFSMDTWQVDRLPEDEYVPDVSNEVEVFDGWYFDGKAFYRKDK